MKTSVIFEPMGLIIWAQLAYYTPEQTGCNRPKPKKNPFLCSRQKIQTMKTFSVLSLIFVVFFAPIKSKLFHFHSKIESCIQRLILLHYKVSNLNGLVGDDFLPSRPDNDCETFILYTVLTNYVAHRKLCKGLFTRNDTVTVYVKVSMKVWHCLNGERNFDGQNGLNTYSVGQKPLWKRSKMPIIKTVTLTIRVNEALITIFLWFVAYIIEMYTIPSLIDMYMGNEKNWVFWW